MRFICLVVFCSLPAWSQQRIMPHITTTDGNFTTEILIQNNAPTSASGTVTGYDIDGLAINTAPITLAAGTALETTAQELFGEPVSHFTIDAPPMLEFSVNYLANTPGAAPANVGETVGSFVWTFYGGDWTTTFDALAVVNMSDSQTTSVNLGQWDFEGNNVDFHLLSDDLAPLAKTLFVLSTEFSQVDGTLFQLVADQEVAVVGLRGNLDSTFLWANNTVPVTWYQWSLTRNLIGYWELTYADGPTFDRSYNLSSESRDFDNGFNKFIFGTNANNVLNAVGTYFADDIQAYAIFELSLSGGTDDLYLFFLEGDTILDGCHFNVFSDGTNSDCHPLTGGRMPFTVDFTPSNTTKTRVMDQGARAGSHAIGDLDPEYFATTLRKVLDERRKENK